MRSNYAIANNPTKYIDNPQEVVSKSPFVQQKIAHQINKLPPGPHGIILLMRRLSVYYHRELSTELECKLIKLKHLKWLLSKEISDLLQNKKQTRPDASYNTIKALYHKLSTIDHTYNTEDGQIRWLLDNNFDVHLAHFWGILPQETRATMKQWKKMDMSLKQAVEIRGKLSTIDKKYNTEDGQIRWLLDNTIDVNLGKFWTILPQETRATMKQWKKMDMSLKQAVAIREKLSTIDHTYNTEDGQIRWLLDNTIDVHLGHFWGILPQQIKIKMTQWSYMNMPLKQAVAIRKKLSSIDKKYNTEDGQIRWLQDNKYNVHLGQFWSVIPQEVREKMTQWSYMNMPLKQAIEIRGKLSTIDKKYNTEDGQMHWLQDNKYNIHLGQFWGIIPRQVRKKMKRWEKIDMPLKQAVAIRKKLSSIDRKYNTKDGQICWLQDNKYNVHLGQFWSVLPQEVRKKMTQWSYMNIPLEDAIVALQMSDETYGEYMKTFYSRLIDHHRSSWSIGDLAHWSKIHKIGNFVGQLRVKYPYPTESLIDWDIIFLEVMRQYDTTIVFKRKNKIYSYLSSMESDYVYKGKGRNSFDGRFGEQEYTHTFSLGSREDNSIGEDSIIGEEKSQTKEGKRYTAIKEYIENNYSPYQQELIARFQEDEELSDGECDELEVLLMDIKKNFTLSHTARSKSLKKSHKIIPLGQ